MAKITKPLSAFHAQCSEDRALAESMAKDMEFREATRFYNDISSLLGHQPRNFISYTDVLIRIGPVAYEASRTNAIGLSQVIKTRKKNMQTKGKRHEERA